MDDVDGEMREDEEAGERGERVDVDGREGGREYGLWGGERAGRSDRCGVRRRLVVVAVAVVRVGGR